MTAGKMKTAFDFDASFGNVDQHKYAEQQSRKQCFYCKFINKYLRLMMKKQ